jgi:CxxC-x17-CxxC domain-containing protein
MAIDNQGRTLFKAKCSDCGEECEVPFKPMAGKPVYCKKCFRNHSSFNSFRRN